LVSWAAVRLNVSCYLLRSVKVWSGVIRSSVDSNIKHLLTANAAMEQNGAQLEVGKEKAMKEIIFSLSIVIMLSTAEIV
jgi:hypothetical protein